MECVRASATGRRILAFSAASNVTGAYSSFLEITRIAHGEGALVVLDASQLVAHREIVPDAASDDSIPDAIVFAGHKMYAPFGAGFLVVRRNLLRELAMDDLGGGTVSLVTRESYVPSHLEDRRELAGSPNLLGVVATALTGEYLRFVVTYRAIEAHAQILLDTLHAGCEQLPDIEIVAPLDWNARNKTPLLTFRAGNSTPVDLADRLAAGYGIGIRAGHLCQFQFLERLLKLDGSQSENVRARLKKGEEVSEFGLARASFGLDSSPSDCERLTCALREVLCRKRPVRVTTKPESFGAAPIWFTREGLE